MRRVAIVGSSHFPGWHLLASLDRDPTVEMLVGIDISPRQLVSTGSSFSPSTTPDASDGSGSGRVMSPSAADPGFATPRVVETSCPSGGALSGLLLEHWIDTLVCLEDSIGHIRPGGPTRDEYARQVEAILDACHRSGVHRLVLVSPVEVIAPSLADVRRQGVDAFRLEHPELEVLEITLAPVLGPGACGPLVAALRAPILVSAEAQLRLQFLHLEDALRALVPLILGDAQGRAAVAPPDSLSLSEISRATRCPTFAVPGPVLVTCREILQRLPRPLQVQLERFRPRALPLIPLVRESEGTVSPTNPARICSRLALEDFLRSSLDPAVPSQVGRALLAAFRRRMPAVHV